MGFCKDWWVNGLIFFLFDIFIYRMKSVTVSYYFLLPTYLDENNFYWEKNGRESITIHYDTDEQLFELAFEFGKYFMKKSYNLTLK